MIPDNKLSYQFGFFLARRDESEVDVEWLPGAMSASQDTTPSLRIRFPGPPATREVARVVNGQLVPDVELAWSGSGFWTMTLSSKRLDIAFDALAYQDAIGTQLPITTVCSRIAANLVATSHRLPLRVPRLVVTLNAEYSMTSTGLSPGEFVSEHYFSETVRTRVDEEGDLADAQARLNLRTRWPIGDNETPINRIESASARWALQASGQARSTLKLDFDVNTGPELSDDTDFSGADFVPFYRSAASWIEKRLQRLGAVSDG